MNLAFRLKTKWLMIGRAWTYSSQLFPYVLPSILVILKFYKGWKRLKDDASYRSSYTNGRG